MNLTFKKISMIYMLYQIQDFHAEFRAEESLWKNGWLIVNKGQIDQGTDWKDFLFTGPIL